MDKNQRSILITDDFVEEVNSVHARCCHADPPSGVHRDQVWWAKHTLVLSRSLFPNTRRGFLIVLMEAGGPPMRINTVAARSVPGTSETLPFGPLSQGTAELP